MTDSLFFCRARLKRGASVKALAPLLLGKTGRGGSSEHTGHHLVWSLFADTESRKRDFLWREISTGTFFVLSARRPVDRHDLFEIAEPRPFEPSLAEGDVLGFTLRANAVVRRRDSDHNHSVKHDIVMDALSKLPAGERAVHRHAAVRREGLAWLTRQGETAGFSVLDEKVRIDGYEQHSIDRGASGAPMSFSTLDFEGLLTVSEPSVFLAALANGFGAAKAYGCGLMLIRRA